MANSSKSNPTQWVILALVVGGGAYGVWRWQQSKSTASGPVEFRTNVVSRGEIIQSVTANGALNPVRVVSVGSQVSGIITEMNVDFNSVVKEGDVLAKIDPSTFERDLVSAQADLANAKAALELAQFNEKRARELFGSKLVSESDFQQAVVALHQAEAVVKTRQASVERAQVNLDKTTISAPIGGIVISRKVDAGQTVAASFNTPEMFTIANDLRKMQIETMVSEADVGGVEEGQKVNFSVDAFPQRQFSGKVKQLRYAAVTNQNVVTYTAVVEVDNRDMKLRPGMTANPVSIITASRTNILRIPNAALRFRPSDFSLVVSTNDAVAKAAGTNATSGGARRPEGMPMPPWVAEGRRPTDDERKAFEATLTPEQKEQMQKFRAQMQAARAAGGGGGGGGGMGGGGFGGGMGGFGGGMGGASRPAAPEGPAIRTVYIIDKEKSQPGRILLSAVSVKTGISDGTNTEISAGLKEGDVLVTGISSASTTAAAPAGPLGGNPFGGPPRR